MKAIIRSDDKMRDRWCDLVLAERREVVPVVSGECVYQKEMEAGEYLIRTQMNRQNACVNYVPIPQKAAEKILRLCEKINDSDAIVCILEEMEEKYIALNEMAEYEKLKAELWENSRKYAEEWQKTKEMLTAAEAARLWGLEASTVKKSCQQGRFSEEEARKSGGTWLVTLAGMERLYGSRPEA